MNPTQYPCAYCGSYFDKEMTLQQHVAVVHSADIGKLIPEGNGTKCEQCDKSFSSTSNLRRHIREVHGLSRVRHQCPDCESSYKRPADLSAHKKTKHATTSAEDSVQPSTSSRVSPLPKRRKIQHKGTAKRASSEPTGSHGMDLIPDDGDDHDLCKVSELTDREECRAVAPVHAADGGDRSSSIEMDPSEDAYILENADEVERSLTENGEVLSSQEARAAELARCRLFQPDPETLPAEYVPEDPEMERVYRLNWQQIRTRHYRNNPVQNVYNFRQTGLLSLTDYADVVFRDQLASIKINLSFGYILRNTETGELIYFHPSHNNTRFFDVPRLISSRDDFLDFLTELADIDPLEWARRQRSSSKYIVELVTNVVFYVNKLAYSFIGSNPKDGLPDYVTHNQGLYLMQANGRGEMYNDRKCLFRCLAVHLNGVDQKYCERYAKEHLKTYLDFRGMEYKNFRGVPFQSLTDIESLFKVNIVVYSLCEETDDDRLQTNTAHLIRRSLGLFDNTMYLNLCENHFSYIFNREKYSSQYQCTKCGMFFKRSNKQAVHEKTCKENARLQFRGGMFHVKETIFESLQDVGIVIPEQDRYFPFRACFDYEAYLQKESLNVPDLSKTVVTATHIPLSVSINSNVPGYDSPKCFVTEGNEDELVSQMIVYLNEVSARSHEIVRSKFAYVFNEIDTRLQDRASKPACKDANGRSIKPYLLTLRDAFSDYLLQLPVLGFNSAKYDINVIKAPLYHYLVENEGVKLHIKKGSSHLTLQTTTLMFLDIRNYLAADVSYDKWIKAYECSHAKGRFCYEYLDSLDRLKETNLPPREAFYDSLHDREMSRQDYDELRLVWQHENMQTLRDFLVWYNNLDVIPFLEATEKMFLFYREKRIDMFKQAMSVPGLTQVYLFKNTSAAFSLIKSKDEDMYRTLRDNVVGGPSIVFHRYQEKSKTLIRGGKTCGKILGFDANALYLYAIMDKMPTGNYTRRLAEDNFKLKGKAVPVANIWLEWEARSTGVSIRHQGNNTEKRIGDRRIPVDGFVFKPNDQSNTQSINQGKSICYNFHGCYHHGHACYLTKQSDGVFKFNNSRYNTREELYAKTQEIGAYIRSEGYELIEMWECEFYTERNRNPALKTFCESFKRSLDHKITLTEVEILQAVRDETVYGFVEVDIRVPECLKGKFSEYPPIFKNVEISRNDIGEYMKTFAEEHNIMSKPRRVLIGSMFGEKILIGTPLLKWYLENGLEVTRIYQVIEYTPLACFKDFGDVVSNARRTGDVDQSKKIIGETFKLLGNSAYGKTVTNKEKFQKIKVCNVEKAQKLINNSRFRSLNILRENTFEVSSSPSTIKLDLPLQIGVMVYQYAKLRMLQFYFDFMDTFFDRADWQYCQTDTDSAYIAISGSDLETMVKPHMRDRYKLEKEKWFPRDHTPEMARYDKRTPGLFKLEFEGDGIISICSKTYYCFGADGGEKFSCKGVSRRSDCINKEAYLSVLQTKRTQKGVNKGFKLFGNDMKSYTQTKDAFSYFYAKRKVLEDGVSTTYLDI